MSVNLNFSTLATFIEISKLYDSNCFYFQTTFVLSLGPFVFFNVQKTKYLQLLTSVMRWLAFTIMIVYALKNLLIHGPRGDPPIASLAGMLRNYRYLSLISLT